MLIFKNCGLVIGYVQTQWLKKMYRYDVHYIPVFCKVMDCKRISIYKEKNGVT
jgi:hypothetical protein